MELLPDWNEFIECLRANDVDFDEGWDRRVSGKLGCSHVFLLSEEELLTNKLATGRTMDSRCVALDPFTSENPVEEVKHLYPCCSPDGMPKPVSCRGVSEGRRSGRLPRILAVLSAPPTVGNRRVQFLNFDESHPEGIELLSHLTARNTCSTYGYAFFGIVNDCQD